MAMVMGASNQKFLMFSSAISWSTCMNGTRVVFSNADGARWARLVVDDAESARTCLPWRSSPLWFFFYCIC
jgi:hypothetical protein